jgi:hypothetical protein
VSVAHWFVLDCSNDPLADELLQGCHFKEEERSHQGDVEICHAPCSPCKVQLVQQKKAEERDIFFHA